MPVSPPRPWSTWSIEDLLVAKAATGSRISVVLPARNEASLVGGIVGRIRRELLERTALVDELVVIDSDSTDSTAAVARDAGAQVYAAAQIRPDLGPRRGKGEALWKSLFVTSGDVLVFLDADLVEWGPHFVTGLVGPLLAAPEVALVKGCYHRPITSHGSAVTELVGGGRVTELVARPLLALRWPELATVVQPLSGEWSVRRSALAALSMPTGYAVDLAALVDVYAEHGPAGIAQVDLGRRRHTHQKLPSLGAMAVEILAMADRRYGVTPVPPGSVTLRQYTSPDDVSHPTDRVVDLGERPPAASVRPGP
jgi:glucosyl-3-phosphoglycerate synthase